VDDVVLVADDGERPVPGVVVDAAGAPAAADPGVPPAPSAAAAFPDTASGIRFGFFLTKSIANPVVARWNN
jgi:hypothetical protein